LHVFINRSIFFLIFFFAAQLWQCILCIVAMLLKRIDTRTKQRIRFQSRAAKNKHKNYTYLITRKLKPVKWLKNRYRYRKILKTFAQRISYFPLFHKDCLLFWVYLKKSFSSSIFNAIFNILKINFGCKCLGIFPYRSIFKSWGFQENRGRTDVILALWVEWAQSGVRKTRASGKCWFWLTWLQSSTPKSTRVADRLSPMLTLRNSDHINRNEKARHFLQTFQSDAYAAAVPCNAPPGWWHRTWNRTNSSINDWNTKSSLRTSHKSGGQMRAQTAECTSLLPRFPNFSSAESRSVDKTTSPRWQIDVRHSKPTWKTNKKNIAS